jgi:hypothetical protein
MTWRFAAAALAALAFAAAPAPALGACADVPGNLVVNCSFEQPANAPGTFRSVGPGGDIGGWTVSQGGDSVDLVEKSFFGGYPVADGSQSLDLNTNNPGGVEQRVATVAGGAYRISFQLSGYPAPSANCSATEPHRIRVSGAGFSQDFSFSADTTAKPPGNQRFEAHTVDFVATGSALIQLRGLNAGCAGPVVDDVTVTRIQAPAPALGRSMTAVPRSGAVLVKAAGSTTFAPLGAFASLRVGTIVDARHGRVRITATSGGNVYSADFYGGEFQIAQLAKKGATADMKLFGGNFAGCPRAARPAAGNKRHARQLWGSGSGPFRTIGRFSASTVRGTTWLTKDTCSGTLTVVKAGSVSVRDFVKRRNVIVRAGDRYLAAARRG